MRHLILLGLLFIILSLPGCIPYTSGSSYGYVTTVEGGIFWSHAWFRAELESSQTDDYMVQRSGDALKARLREVAESGQRVKITFRRHLLAATTGRADEIVDVVPAPKR